MLFPGKTTVIGAYRAARPPTHHYRAQMRQFQLKIERSGID